MMRKTLGFIIIVLFSFSCEKVIDIPLDEAERKVVIEGNLFDIPLESFVKLSKTGSVYDDSGFEKISGASVVVADQLGNNYVFSEDPADLGTYLNTAFIAEPNHLYYLVVNVGADEYTSKSVTNSSISLDSLDYEVISGGFGQAPGDTSYIVFYNFSDLASEVNYYRTVPYLSSGNESGIYYMVDDQLFNGGNIRQPFYGQPMDSGDTLTAYLLSMDENVYKYYVSLSSNLDSGPFSATPANPVTNIDGGAIGYFAAFTTDVQQLILP